MDAKRYARVREIFLEAEELPAEQQRATAERLADGDAELVDEVMSLLGEHDADDARREGQQATRLPPPSPDTRPSQTDPSSQSNPSSRSLGAVDAHATSGRDLAAASAQATRTGAQRTYAAPRDFQDAHSHDGRSPRQGRDPSPKTLMWRRYAKKRRRYNMWWLWVSAILPTFFVGFMTYRRVDDLLRRALREEMSARVDSVAIGADRFLDQKAGLVRSWSRQAKIRQSVLELVDVAESPPNAASPNVASPNAASPNAATAGEVRDPSSEALRSGPQHAAIERQLTLLSGLESVEYTVWGRDHQVLSSSSADRADIGSEVERSLSAELTFAMRGETVLVGPHLKPVSTKTTPRKPGKRPVRTAFVPQMSMIVPIENERNEIVAVMQIRNFGMFREFNSQFRTSSLATEQDAYAVNAAGRMITETSASPALRRYQDTDPPPAGAPDAPPGPRPQLTRVSDPGVVITPDTLGSVDRSVRPLTLAAASVTAEKNNVRVTPYPNYVGRDVVGGWRWLGTWQIGVVVERPADVAFRLASVVRYGFLILAALLSVTAIGAAAMIANKSSLLHAAVHPLSNYDLIEELGAGGMGIVYRARHRHLGRETALKILRSDRRNREDRLRFDREAKLAATLTNPHSVMIHDYGVASDSEAFCVMELLRGLTLYEVVARSGHQPIGRAVAILRQVCDAIGEAHQRGLMHRDLKPQNVMLSLDPSVGDWAVVFDFGLAKPLAQDPDVFQTSETIWAGTPMYMAPERFREPSVMDPRSDIYSIGCIAYFLLSGRPPFAECDPEAMFALILREHPIQISTHLNKPFPDDVDAVVQKCMAKNVEQRHATLADLATDLDRLADFYPWTDHQARTWWTTHATPTAPLPEA